VGSRNITLALIAIALGAAAWVLLSKRHTEQDANSSAATESKGAVQQAVLPAPAIPSSDVSDSNSESRKEESPPPVNAAPKTISWPDSTLRFADQADTDPLLSREIEYQIQRSIDTNIDARKFKVEPVKCRGTSCQILASAREPGEFRSAWGLVLGTMLKDLTDTPVLNPSTGIRLGAADPQRIEYLSEGGIVTIIGFMKPAGK
jgi:hypothetical protein